MLPALWLFMKTNPLKAFKYGICLVGIIALLGLAWRMQYLSSENTRLSGLVINQEAAIKTLKADAEAAAKISARNAQRVKDSERSRAAILLEIERVKDETTCSTPVMRDTYQRLRSALPGNN